MRRAVDDADINKQGDEYNDEEKNPNPKRIFHTALKYKVCAGKVKRQKQKEIFSENKAGVLALALFSENISFNFLNF